MPFIGVIAKENDYYYIKNAIAKNTKNNKFEIFHINKKTIENMKNIKFDIIVANENIENYLKDSKYLEYIMSSAKYLIINSDIENHINSLTKISGNVITYGLNLKSSLTISSIKEDNILLCIQRSIKGINGNLIEEQEFNFKIERNNGNKVYNILIIFAILQIFGENLQKI